MSNDLVEIVFLAIGFGMGALSTLGGVFIRAHLVRKRSEFVDAKAAAQLATLTALESQNAIAALEGKIEELEAERAFFRSLSSARHAAGSPEKPATGS